MLENGTFLGMRTRCDYLTTADYITAWGTNRETRQTATGFGSEEEATRHAANLVDQMRREGAASAIRFVRVRRRGDWDKDKFTYRCPPLFEASYYDEDQGLTDAEVYASRVHEWHWPSDRFNRIQVARNSHKRIGYPTWSDDWGPQPDFCMACGVATADPLRASSR